jgi:hypothetical protein
MCLDEITYRVMSQQEHVVAYKFDESDEDIQYLIENAERRPNDLSPFHWALTPYVCNFVLQNCNIDSILYTDSDLFFYRDASIIASEKPIGLTTHKHENPTNHSDVGYYNVGAVWISQELGKKFAEWWKDITIYQWEHKDFGTCGDQKYLELIPDIFGDDCIEILDTRIGHAAPWNVGHCNLDIDRNNNKLVLSWDASNLFGIETTLTQDLIFYHFSHYIYDLGSRAFSADGCGEWGPILETDWVSNLYMIYFLELERVYYENLVWHDNIQWELCSGTMPEECVSVRTPNIDS